MKEKMKEFLDSFKKSTIPEKILMTLLVIIGIALTSIMAYYFITEVFPILVVAAVIGLLVIYSHSQSKKEQQARIQEEEIRNIIWFYEQTARRIICIFKEYNAPLGIAPTTVGSIYSAKKFIRVSGLKEPVLVYSVERKSSDTNDFSDIKSAIQQRFNQENLRLYLIKIDQNDSQFLKIYILPIQSENAINWANADRKKQFIDTKPQKPGNREDKDF